MCFPRDEFRQTSVPQAFSILAALRGEKSPVVSIQSAPSVGRSRKWRHTSCSAKVFRIPQLQSPTEMMSVTRSLTDFPEPVSPESSTTRGPRSPSSTASKLGRPSFTCAWVWSTSLGTLVALACVKTACTHISNSWRDMRPGGRRRQISSGEPKENRRSVSDVIPSAVRASDRCLGRSMEARRIKKQCRLDCNLED